MEQDHPGCLLNNCSYDLWHRRYVASHYNKRSSNSLAHIEPLSKPWSQCSTDKFKHISQWTVRLHVLNRQVTLFGCAEDVRCKAAVDHDFHAEELEHAPFTRTLCSQCEVLVCHSCWGKLQKHRDGGTIPTSYMNDHFYGYVDKFLVHNNVTWLECAAASVC